MIPPSPFFIFCFLFYSFVHACMIPETRYLAPKLKVISPIQLSVLKTHTHTHTNTLHKRYSFCVCVCFVHFLYSFYQATPPPPPIFFFLHTRKKKKQFSAQNIYFEYDTYLVKTVVYSAVIGKREPPHLLHYDTAHWQWGQHTTYSMTAMAPSPPSCSSNALLILRMILTNSYNNNNYSINTVWYLQYAVNDSCVNTA